MYTYIQTPTHICVQRYINRKLNRSFVVNLNIWLLQLKSLPAHCCAGHCHGEQQALKISQRFCRSRVKLAQSRWLDRFHLILHVML